MTVLGRGVHGFRDGFLRFNGEFVQSHLTFSPYIPESEEAIPGPSMLGPVYWAFLAHREYRCCIQTRRVYHFETWRIRLKLGPE